MLKVNDQCVRCGLCKRDCPAKIIELVDKPQIKAGKENRCIKCGHCEAVCPVHALENDQLPQDEVFEYLPPLSKVQVEAAISNRFTCRFFTKEEVAKEDVEFLTNMARHTGSGKNQQGVKFLVYGKDKLKEMQKITVERGLKHPDYAAMAQFSQRTGVDIIFYDAPLLVVVVVDKKAALHHRTGEYALCYMDLFAQSVKLGTCFCGFFDDVYNLNPTPFKALMDFDTEKYEYVGSLLIGHPDVKHYRSTRRNPLDIEWK